MITEPAASLPLVVPAGAAVGALLAFALAAVAPSRQHALTAALTIALLAALAAFYDSMPLSHGYGPLFVRLGFALLLAEIVAAPLLDRARFPGLVVGALLGGGALYYYIPGSLPQLLPSIAGGGLMLVALFAAALLGLIGSALVPIHPTRSQRRAPDATSIWRALGYVLLAVTLGTVAMLFEPSTVTQTIALSALAAALLSLLWARYTHHPQPLLRAAQGVLAGTLAALALSDDTTFALIAAALAAFGVARGEAASHALGLDDPSQHVGTLLLPALVGLLLPGIDALNILADHLRWLGATLGVTLVVALVLWPAIMATLGLAANSKRVREGLDNI